MAINTQNMAINTQNIPANSPDVVKDSFGCVWCWSSESDMCNGDCTESLRNAARKAAEEEENV